MLRYTMAVLLAGFTAVPATASCPNGAVYTSMQSGQSILVKRIGSGMSQFTPGGDKQAAIALDFVLADGQRGAIFGPMRSVMFPVESRFLTAEGYTWQPAGHDPQGFFRVLSDDGQAERFILTYVGCAP